MATNNDIIFTGLTNIQQF